MRLKTLFASMNLHLRVFTSQQNMNLPRMQCNLLHESSRYICACLTVVDLEIFEDYYFQTAWGNVELTPQDGLSIFVGSLILI
jgi:hypothetical protein